MPACMQSDAPDFHTRRELSDEQWFERFADGLRAEGDAEAVPAFLALVGPLEQRARRRLTGLGRQACIRAFRTQPDGFARLCTEALARGRTNPLGLLIVMVRAGEHKLDPPSTTGEKSPAEEERSATVDTRAAIARSLGADAAEA
jgi:hypothetical protein